MGRVSYGFFALFSIFQTLTGHTPPTRHILRICPSHPTPHADTMASGGGGASLQTKCVGASDCMTMVSRTTVLRDDDGPLCSECFEVNASETITFVDGGDWQEGIPYISYAKITDHMLDELTRTGTTDVDFKGEVPVKELFVLKKEQLDSIIKLVPVDKLDKFKAIVAGSVRGCGCLNAECLTCQCDTCGECLDHEVKTCHHAKFGKFCKCSPETKQGELKWNWSKHSFQF